MHLSNPHSDCNFYLCIELMVTFTVPYAMGIEMIARLGDTLSIEMFGYTVHSGSTYTLKRLIDTDVTPPPSADD